MKRIIGLLLACFLLGGCGISVENQSHQLGYTTIAPTEPTTIGPTEDPIPANPYGPMDFG